MRIVYYGSPEEKKKLKLAANKLGESTIHDDFLDKNGKATNGNSGKLTFKILSSTPNPKFIRMKALRKKLKNDTMTFTELKEYLRLNGQ